MMDCDKPPQIYIDFELERKCGRLSSDYSGYLRIEDKIVGEIDKNNVVHWNSSVTMDDLKKAIQSQLDYTRWQANRMMEEEDEDR